VTQSKPSTTLKDAHESLKLVLEVRNEGTADYPKQVARVDTAYQRALDRAGGGELPNYDHRGGSSVSDDDDAERKNRQRVMRQAVIDVRKIDELVIRIASATHQLRKLVDRHAETVGPHKQDEDTGLPGCRSCQRKEQDGDSTIGGHFAGVTDKAPESGLCRQCNDFKNATGGLPPVMWCHLRHTKGGSHANRWLAKEFPALKESVDRKEKHKTKLTAEDLALRTEDLVVSQPGGTVNA
jgi:hypothetical protein